MFGLHSIHAKERILLNYVSGQQVQRLSLKINQIENQTTIQVPITQTTKPSGQRKNRSLNVILC